jgi:hypothetical protein
VRRFPTLPVYGSVGNKLVLYVVPRRSAGVPGPSTVPRALEQQMSLSVVRGHRWIIHRRFVHHVAALHSPHLRAPGGPGRVVTDGGLQGLCVGVACDAVSAFKGHNLLSVVVVVDGRAHDVVGIVWYSLAACLSDR